MADCGFLNNSSVGAFVGAFSAFCLVVTNDWRRNRKKVTLIKQEIEITHQQSQNKTKAVTHNLNLLKDHNKIVPAPFLKFQLHTLNNLSMEVRDRLTVEQKSALGAITYTMEATDGILDAAYFTIKQIMDTEKDDIKRIDFVNRLVGEFEDAIVNLGRLSDMCLKYINGKYKEIIT